MGRGQRPVWAPQPQVAAVPVGEVDDDDYDEIGDAAYAQIEALLFQTYDGEGS